MLQLLRSELETMISWPKNQLKFVGRGKEIQRKRETGKKEERERNRDFQERDRVWEGKI